MIHRASREPRRTEHASRWRQILSIAVGTVLMVVIHGVVGAYRAPDPQDPGADPSAGKSASTSSRP